MKLICLDLEDSRLGFIEDLTFSVIPALKALLMRTLTSWMKAKKKMSIAMVLSLGSNILGTP